MLFDDNLLIAHKSKDAHNQQCRYKRQCHCANVDGIPEKVTHMGSLKRTPNKAQRAKQYLDARQRVLAQKHPQDALRGPDRAKKRLQLLQLIYQIPVYKNSQWQFQLSWLVRQDWARIVVVNPLLWIVPVSVFEVDIRNADRIIA